MIFVVFFSTCSSRKMSHIVRWVYQLILLIIIFSGLIFILYFTFSLSSIEFHLKPILKKIIRHYILHLEDKQLMDTIQIYHECCGIDEYSNWFNVFWKDTNTSVPYSCCRLEHVKPCMSQNLVTNVNAIETINSRGCASTLSRHVEKLMVNGILMFVTICIFSSLLLAAYRIMITSIENAVRTHNDPSGIGKGYLFKLRKQKQIMT
jgi:PREDICTED: similar to tetraspanin F139